MDERPSYLQVDRWAVAGDPRVEVLRADPEWAEHLAAIESEPLEIPAWVLAARRPRRRWWLLVALAATVLAAIALRPGAYVGAKGAATAVIHLRTASGSRIWDGATPLRAGDEVRLELHGVGSPWFAVVYAAADERPVVLATGRSEGLLPRAWAFDSDPVGGRLIVVASPTDPSGEPVDAVLDLPHAVEIPLR